MTKIELLNKDILAVDIDGTTEYGCNQEWYGSHWKRTAGCGPSVVSTILGYIEHRSGGVSLPRDAWLALMDDVWEDVTPTMRGLPSTALVVERVHKYLERRRLDYTVSALDVPGKNDPRAAFSAVRDFIAAALARDTPVAFLNLDTGGLSTLDEWHWTIIPSIEYDGASTFVTDYNCGKVFAVNVKEWYDNTLRGGGFLTIFDN